MHILEILWHFAVIDIIINDKNNFSGSEVTNTVFGERGRTKPLVSVYTMYDKNFQFNQTCTHMFENAEAVNGLQLQFRTISHPKRR